MCQISAEAVTEKQFYLEERFSAAKYPLNTAAAPQFAKQT
jgi:hypothetical protein